MHGGALWPISDQSYLLIMRYVIVYDYNRSMNCKTKHITYNKPMFPWKGERGINQYGERENEKWVQNRDLETEVTNSIPLLVPRFRNIS